MNLTAHICSHGNRDLWNVENIHVGYEYAVIDTTLKYASSLVPGALNFHFLPLACSMPYLGLH